MTPVEIDFVIQQKHLSDAGYNVLAYDIRNRGTSSAANGGISGIGRWSGATARQPPCAQQDDRRSTVCGNLRQLGRKRRGMTACLSASSVWRN
jgi:hypothetical protein